jgi:hypothetical protein
MCRRRRPTSSRARRSWRAADSEAGARATPRRACSRRTRRELISRSTRRRRRGAARGARGGHAQRLARPPRARRWRGSPVSDGAVARAARGYLQRLASDRRPEFVALVVQVLSDPSADARRWTGAALAAESAPELAYVRAADRTGSRRRSAAAATCPTDRRALERIAGRRYGADLAAWQRWWSDGQGRSARSSSWTRRCGAARRRPRGEARDDRCAPRSSGCAARPPETRAPTALDEESRDVAARRARAAERAAAPRRRPAGRAGAAPARARARPRRRAARRRRDRDEEAAWGALAAELARATGGRRAAPARLRGRDPAVPRTEYLPALRRCVRDQPDADVAPTIEATLAVDGRRGGARPSACQTLADGRATTRASRRSLRCSQTRGAARR